MRQAWMLAAILAAMVAAGCGRSAPPPTMVEAVAPPAPAGVKRVIDRAAVVRDMQAAYDRVHADAARENVAPLDRARRDELCAKHTWGVATRHGITQDEAEAIYLFSFGGNP